MGTRTHPSSPLTRRLYALAKRELTGTGYGSRLFVDALGVAAMRTVLRVYGRGPTDRDGGRSTLNSAALLRALEFLHDHALGNVALSDVADAVGVNRRVLEKAFRAELGHGINEELIQARLRAVANRLETTDLSVTDIASQTGYTRPNHLFRTFRKQVVPEGKARVNKELAKCRVQVRRSGEGNADGAKQLSQADAKQSPIKRQVPSV